MCSWSHFSFWEIFLILICGDVLSVISYYDQMVAFKLLVVQSVYLTEVKLLNYSDWPP